jgi:hypothetical protein
MKKSLLLASLLVGLLSAPAHAKHLHPERWYVDNFCKGIQESHVYTYNWRVDCETPKEVQEFDFAAKRDEALGQALRYAAVTGKQGVVVLILETESDRKYVNELLMTIQHHDLNIRVRVVKPK